MTATVITPETDPDGFGPRPDIFVAGGITGCPDWQAQAIQMLTELGPDNLVIANPRRKHSIPSNGSEAMGQISWEWKQLAVSPVMLFWFAEHATQPIALFELGKALGRGQAVAVGAHHDYPRRFDVTVQTALERNAQVINDTLEGTVTDALYQLDRIKGGRK